MNRNSKPPEAPKRLSVFKRHIEPYVPEDGTETVQDFIENLRDMGFALQDVKMYEYEYGGYGFFAWDQETDEEYQARYDAWVLEVEKHLTWFVENKELIAEIEAQAQVLYALNAELNKREDPPIGYGRITYASKR